MFLFFLKVFTFPKLVNNIFCFRYYFTSLKCIFLMHKTSFFVFCLLIFRLSDGRKFERRHLTRLLPEWDCVYSMHVLTIFT